MDPMVLLALASGLGGLFFKDRSGEQMLRMIQMMTSPAFINRNARGFYQGFLDSPAYGAAQRNILGASNAAQGQLASSLGERGLGTSGIGDISRAVGASLTGTQMANMQSQAWQNALMQAIALSQSQLSAAGQGGLRQRNVGADMYGAGLNALAMYLSRQPGKTTNPTVTSRSGGYGPPGGMPWGDSPWGNGPWDPRPSGGLSYQNWYLPLLGGGR